MNFRRRHVIIIMILAIALLAAGCQGNGGATNNPDIVAKVGDETISKDQYDKHFVLFKKNYEDMYGENVWSLDVGGKTFLQAVKENVLDKLINDTAIIMYLENNNVEIDESQVEEQYKTYMEGMKEQKEIQDFFTENGIDEAFIKQQIRTDLYMDKFYSSVTEGLELSDDTLKKYYDENQANYRNLQVKASHILVEKEEEAKEVLQKLKAGGDFAELAKEYSKDPGSGAQGGDLGYFSKGMMVPEFEEAAFSLELNEISEPVKSQYGYHIIKVSDKIDEIYPFEEVKEEIKSMFIDQEIGKKLEEIKGDYKLDKYEDNIK